MDLIELIKDPKKVHEVTQEEIPLLLAALSALQGILAARLLAVGPTFPSEKEDCLLGIDEAADRLNLSKDYLYRHSKKFPFTVRIGNSLRFSSNGIDKYIHQRKGRLKNA